MENFPPPENQNLLEDLPPKSFQYKKIVFYIVGVLFLGLFIYFSLFNVPRKFPEGAIVAIEPGASLRNTSLQLKNKDIIRSRTIFEALVILYSGDRYIISTDYLFEKPASVFEVARRVSKGESRLAAIKITIPEGFDISDIANTVSLKLLNFDKNKFLLEAQDKEGYLFPDTYFFLTRATHVDVLKYMTANFEKKIAPLRAEILTTGRTEEDIIIMASIVEKEAKGDADRATIAGILWKRISLGRALEVDAAPVTYKEKGLPKNPICNPGLEAIKATIYPEASPYLYYLHDKEGNIHYAKNFEEHKKNKFKYLR